MIILEQSDIDEADKTAILRRAFGIRSGRAQTRGLDDIPAMERFWYEVIGCRAEVAAHKLFRTTWLSAYSEELVTDGDLLGFIEIKGVARPKDRLLIKEEKLKKDHAYLLIDGTFHPCWQPIGWLWGYEAARVEYRGKFGIQPDCFKIPRSMPPLHSIKKLFDIAIDRRRDAA